MGSLFSWRALSLHHFVGWLIALANLVNAALAAGFLMLVVSHSISLFKPWCFCQFDSHAVGEPSFQQQPGVAVISLLLA